MIHYLWWASLNWIENWFAFPNFLGESILAKENVDVRIVNMGPRLFIFLLVIKQYIHYPWFASFQCSEIISSIIISQICNKLRVAYWLTHASFSKRFQVSVSAIFWIDTCLSNKIPSWYREAKRWHYKWCSAVFSYLIKGCPVLANTKCALERTLFWLFTNLILFVDLSCLNSFY